MTHNVLRVRDRLLCQICRPTLLLIHCLLHHPRTAVNHTSKRRCGKVRTIQILQIAEAEMLVDRALLLLSVDVVEIEVVQDLILAVTDVRRA